MRVSNINRQHPMGINESIEEALTAFDQIARDADILVALHHPGVWERLPGGHLA